MNMINSIMMKERTAIREVGNHNYHWGFRKTRLCCLSSDCGELEEFSTSGVFDI